MEKKHLKRQIIFHLPHPPPARARPSTSLRFRSGRARSDCSLPPAPPAGGVENKTMQHVRSLAGTRLRFDSLRSACSPLAHYATLGREQAALLRYATFHFATLVGSLPSISLLWDIPTNSDEKYLPPPTPPLAPARSRPIAVARDVPGQTARCPPPRPRGA